MQVKLIATEASQLEVRSFRSDKFLGRWSRVPGSISIGADPLGTGVLTLDGVLNKLEFDFTYLMPEVLRW